MADDTLECRASTPIEKIPIADLRRWMPLERNVDPQTFEIGLVLAGATSAGAYTAGVMDFLFEAFDAWQDARDRGEPVPNHRAVIKIITGASAGGINGAIAAAACRHDFLPARPGTHDVTGPSNPFYNGWVRQVDILPLLGTGDLADRQLKSVLNCDVLTEIALSTVDFKSPAERTRTWLDNPLAVVLTVANLQGVAYRVRFEGQTGFDHEMITHRDEMAFAIPTAATAPAGRLSPAYLPLANPNGRDRPDWKVLAYSALATSAFPLALAPRLIARPFSDYEYRFAYPHFGDVLVYSQPHGGGPDRYDFATVDGGALNNEPFQIAHRALAGSRGQNPREGDKANRAVVLVDPFTDPRAAVDPPSTALGKVAGRLLGMFMSQPRFEQIDLTLALAGDVYSRFMIAPARPEAKGSRALASGGLGSFLGFLNIAYRHHDYMLGRANCQAFLRDWFVLPSTRTTSGAAPNPGDNPLFDGWPQAALDDPAYRSTSKNRAGHRQIVPLMSKVRAPEPVPAWPTNAFAGFSAIEGPVKTRLDAAYEPLRDSFLGGIKNSLGRWTAKRAVDTFWSLKGRSAIMDMAKEAIDKAVADVNGRPFA